MKRLILLAAVLFNIQASAWTFTNILFIAPGSVASDNFRVGIGKLQTNIYYITNIVTIVSNSVVTASNAFYTASNNLQSQITAESTSLATNTAAFGIRINPLVAGTRWTNDAQRATAEIETKFTDAVGGVPQCSVTVEHGTQTTNNWQISPVGGGLGATLTTPLTNRYSFRLSPSAVLIFTDTSSGGASSAISRSVVFRE